MKKINFIPTNVCATEMIYYVEENNLLNAIIRGGCAGGSQAVCMAAMQIKDIDTIINTFGGIICPGSETKKTSCAQQFALGLYLYLKLENNLKLTEEERKLIVVEEVLNKEVEEEKITKKVKSYSKRNLFNNF